MVSWPMICLKRLERKSAQRLVYLRPNLLYTKLFIIAILLHFPRRSDRSAGTKAAVNVLLFLLCRFQDLCGMISISLNSQDQRLLTWNEHNKLSSTLIIAPALSNSPQ